jgi:hypothetical protein
VGGVRRTLNVEKTCATKFASSCVYSAGILFHVGDATDVSSLDFGTTG